jgi:hypothetical protein
MKDDETGDGKNNNPPKIEEIKPPVSDGGNDVIAKNTDSEKETTTAEKPKKNDADKAKPTDGNEKRCWDNHTITAWANVIMAAGTIFAVVISALSLCVSNESLRLTRESIAGSGAKDSAIIEISKSTSEATRVNAEATKENVSVNNRYIEAYRNLTEIQNRAVISILVGGFDMLVDTITNKVIFTGEFENVGVTPAYNVRIGSFAYISEKFESPSESDIENRLSETTCVVAAKQRNNFFKIELPIPDDDFNIIRRGLLKVGIIGCITYDDAFGKSHFTHSYTIFSPETNRLIGNAPYDYNDAN